MFSATHNKWFLMAVMAVSVAALSACSSNKDLGDSEGITIIDPTYDDQMGQSGAVMADDYGTASTVGEVESAEISGMANQTGLAAYAGDLIFFETDSSNLTSDARYILEQQARWLNNFPNVNITIEGHADERGTREYNLALGERRASSVKNYLIAMGVDPRRLNVISYGKERPMVVGNGAQFWSQNRRAKTSVQ